MEHLLERLQLIEFESNNDGSWSLLSDIANTPIIDSTISQKMQLLKQKYDQIIPIARERCERLRHAIIKCDYFEQALCNCQSWSLHMSHILGWYF